jgi:tryptophanyl-tRNA synthetase
MKLMKKRMVSGVQPSGDLHIGNYLGAIAQWIKYQDEYELFAMVVDLHAITVPQKPEDLRRRTIEVVKMYLALGLDPEKTTIFIQSHVHEHAELCWLLNTITRNGDLTKMTQFKDKSGLDLDELGEEAGIEMSVQILQAFKEKFNAVGVGLFDYPVLMAGDIMLYDADFVPVGADQVQHVELTRTIGRRFNKRFAKSDKEPILTLPQPLLQQSGARIMALDNPLKKMSKSTTSENSSIALHDNPEKARRKIMKAVTDSGSDIVFHDDKPALKNLLTIYALLAKKTPQEIETMYAGKGYAEFKRDLSDIVANFLEDFQGKLSAISDNEVMRVLRKGAEKARILAKAKMERVKEAMGFVLEE